MSSARLQELVSGLSPAQWKLLMSLDGVRLATGQQLARLHLPGQDRQCRRVLARLVEQGLVLRLERRIGGVRAGSSGYVYALDRAGQRLLSTRGPAGGSRQRRPWTPGQPFLAHSLAVTETFVRLVEAERRGVLELVDWQGEPLTWRRFVGRGGAQAVLKPDALVRVGLGEFEDAWFVEVDLGTEAPSTLKRKCELYREYWASGREQARHGLFPRVLFLVPNEERKSVVSGVLGRQPKESWALFAVARFDDLVEVIVKGAAS